MNETDYKSPWPYIEEAFFELAPSEKALVLNYARRLLRDDPVSPSLINAVSAIHEKYPDFHMGCIPNELTMSRKQFSEGA